MTKSISPSPPPPTDAFISEQTQSVRPHASAHFLKEVIKRAPFLVLAKTTPDTLPSYNVNSDFRYFFIGDYMAAFSCLHSKFLRRADAHRRKSRDGGGGGGDISGMISSSVESNHATATRNPDAAKPVAAAEVRVEAAGKRKASSPVVANAKALFPATYEHTFEEDVLVATDHQYPSTLSTVEKCVRPGVDTIVYTTKTAADISGRTYILVASAPYDDVELGLTKFKSGKLAAEMADMRDVPLRWFEGAFENFPLPMVIVDKFGEVVKLNDKIARWEEWQEAVEECMDKVREIRMIDRSKDYWEFSRVGIEKEDEEEDDGHYGDGFRAWIWRPVFDKDLYAICFRLHHDASASDGLPNCLWEAMR